MLFFVRCADSSLGRVDRSTLPQEALMELLLGPIEPKENITAPKFDAAANDIDVRKWDGITIDSDQAIVCIYWSLKGLQGSLLLKWLPPTLLFLNVDINCFNGSLGLQDLPPVVENLSGAKNVFTGSLDLTCLPDSMRGLNLRSNQFSGTVNLTKLPSKMKSLILGSNFIGGIADFDHLPNSLEQLHIDNTYVVGEIWVEPWMEVHSNKSVRLVIENKMAE